MKVGDIVKFTKEHSERSGFKYCADWQGLVLKAPPDVVEVYWVTEYGDSFIADWGACPGVNAEEQLRVISVKVSQLVRHRFQGNWNEVGIVRKIYQQH